MAYQADLGNGQKIYLENRGTQTYVTLASSSSGQQQQSSTGIETGTWTQPPQLTQTPSGVNVEVFTQDGSRFIQVQGSSVSVSVQSPGSDRGEVLPLRQTSNAPTLPPIEPMQPMQPMQPMKMGDMEMNLNSMEMRMGNMEMRMGKSTPNRSFCPQCGAKVEKSDRFCSACGYSLS